MNDLKLLELAKEERKLAYCPYSNFSVGAALLAVNGKVYLGCNIENSAYGETICAERAAFLKAVSEGEREFVKIAVVGGRKGEDELELCAPCGSCRQVMAEFCCGDFEIILSENNKIKLKDLLPLSFSLKE